MKFKKEDKRMAEANEAASKRMAALQMSIDHVTNARLERQNIIMSESPEKDPYPESSPYPDIGEVDREPVPPPSLMRAVREVLPDFLKSFAKKVLEDMDAGTLTMLGKRRFETTILGVSEIIIIGSFYLSSGSFSGIHVEQTINLDLFQVKDLDKIIQSGKVDWTANMLSGSYFDKRTVQTAVRIPSSTDTPARTALRIQRLTQLSTVAGELDIVTPNKLESDIWSELVPLLVINMDKQILENVQATL